MNKPCTRTSLVQVAILVSVHDVYREVRILALIGSIVTTLIFGSAVAGWMKPFPAFLAVDAVWTLLYCALALNSYRAQRAFDVVWDRLDEDQQERIQNALDVANTETP